MKLNAIQSNNKSIPHKVNCPSTQEISSVLSLFSAGRYDEAASLAQAITVRFPMYAFGWTVLGEICSQMGQRENSLVYMLKAIALTPDNPDVYLNLGNSLQNMGQLEAAESCFLDALQIKSDYEEAHNGLGVNYLNMGRLNDAEASFLRSLQVKPDYVEACNNLGNTLRRLGQPDRGVTFYLRALQIRPDFVEVHYNLGNTYFELKHLNEAESSFLQALQIKPDYANAYNNLGNVLVSMNRLDEAEAAYRQALEIKEDFAGAYSNLGSTLMELGRMGEAERFLIKAIELSPNEIRPLATALLYIPYRQDDPRFQQLEAVYTRRWSLTPDERIKLNFAMGKAMEDIGQYDRSFSAYEEGNRLHFQTYPFDETEEERFLENSCNLFTPELFKEYAALAETIPPTQDKRTPIFIVGMPRSGSTLIEQILSCHPAIFGAGEITTLEDVAKKAGELLRAPINAKASLLALRQLGQEYLEQVWKLAPENQYITDKLPENCCHLGVIHLMLPNAKILHATRDPMDTCFSCYTLLRWTGHEYCYDLGALGIHFLRYKKLMQHWLNVLPPGRILDVRYEDNVADTERNIKLILDYLGLSWEPSCLRFHENKRAVRTASVAQVRKPIYSSSVERWKHFEKHLGPLLEAVYPTLNQGSI